MRAAAATLPPVALWRREGSNGPQIYRLIFSMKFNDFGECEKILLYSR
jgi:hypothetical protein